MKAIRSVLSVILFLSCSARVLPGSGASSDAKASSPAPVQTAAVPAVAPAAAAATVAAPARVPAVPNPLVLDLVDSFASASVVNIGWQALSRDWNGVVKNWDAGGAGVAYTPGSTFQDGTIPQGPALFVVPPRAGADFAKVIFSNIRLDSKRTWYLNFKVGLLQPSKIGDGIELLVVAEGRPFMNRGAPWKVLATVVVPPGSVQQISVPMGLWPLRDSFGISLQVSSRATNTGDLLLIDNPKFDAGPTRPELGLQRSGIEWEKRNVVDQIFSEITPLAPKWVRIAVRGSALKDNLVYQAKKVKQLGSKLHLVFIDDAEDADDPANPPYANANDPTFTQICGWNLGIMPISAVNIAHYKNRIEAHLSALKANGITPDSVEVGNELDWFCFNGDIPSSGTIGDVAFAKTTQKYSEILKTTFLAVTKNDPATKVITFGYANVPSSFSTKNIPPTRFLNALKDINGVNYLEEYAHGIGIHMYNHETMQRDFTECANLAAGKPVWVTEFGLNRTNLSGWDRFDAYMNLLELFNSTWKTEVPMVLPYAYESSTDFSFINKQTRALDPVGNIYYSYRP
jgi:hypothetical protein